MRAPDRVRRIPAPKNLEGLEEFSKQQLLRLLRENLLTADERKFVADQLEAVWFPTKEFKQKRRDDAHIFKAQAYDSMIAWIAAVNKITKSDAIGKLTSDDEALKKYIQRGRAKHRRLTRKTRVDKK